MFKGWFVDYFNTLYQRQTLFGIFRDVRITAYCEQEMIVEGDAVAYLKALHRSSPGRTKGKTRKASAKLAGCREGFEMDYFRIQVRRANTELPHSICTAMRHNYKSN